MSRVELIFDEWMAKITEKLMFIQLKRKDHKDLSEEDYDLLFVQFKDYREGAFPMYKNVPDGTAEKTEQQVLFTDGKS